MTGNCFEMIRCGSCCADGMLMWRNGYGLSRRGQHHDPTRPPIRPLPYPHSRRPDQGKLAMIVFENYGEIEIDAITTFGVSVKEGPNPIGFFGTGLKYAVAVLLRHGCKVS